MSHTNLNAFLGLKSDIIDMTQDTMEENEDLSYDDMIAITAVEILKNKKRKKIWRWDWSYSVEWFLSQHMLKARVSHNYAMKKDRARYPPISQIAISILSILMLGASSLHPKKGVK